MAAAIALLSGIGLLVVSAVAEEVAVGLEACSAGRGECEELGLLQQSSRQRGLSRAGTSTNLHLMQWNVGHPKQDEPQGRAYVSTMLQDGSLDFFNVINLKLMASDLPHGYSMVTQNCTAQAYPEGDLTTLVYNSDRWKLTGTPDRLCLSTGKAQGADAAVVARFDPVSTGKKLEVAGAHFAVDTVLSGTWGTSSSNLGKSLQHSRFHDYDVVFLGDTNAFSQWTNPDFAKAWHFALGASTPTQGATLYNSTWLEQQATSLAHDLLGLYWNADRIITSLTGHSTPVDILKTRFKPPLDAGMHHPIRVSLSTSA